MRCARGFAQPLALKLDVISFGLCKLLKMRESEEGDEAKQ
jgi:hypothetical protein